MQRQDHIVICGGGAQARWSYPVDYMGRLAYASAGTYGIENLRYHEDNTTDRPVVTSGTSGTQDTFTASLDAAYTRGDGDTLTVDDASGATEGRYFQIYEDELREGFRLVSTDGSTQLRMDRELAHAYTTSASIRALGWSFSFPSATADADIQTLRRDPFRLTWTWTGVTTYDGGALQREFCWLERSAPGVLCSLGDLLKIDQTIQAQVGERVKPEVYCTGATEEFWQKLRNRWTVPADFHPGDNGRLGAAYYAVAQVYRVHGDRQRGAVLADWAEQRAAYYLESAASGLQPLGALTTHRESDATHSHDPQKVSRRHFAPP